MKVCDSGMANSRRSADDWLTRAETPRHPTTMQPILRTIAALTMALGITGAFYWCITSSLDDMTRADCQAGHVRACEALKQP